MQIVLALVCLIAGAVSIFCGGGPRPYVPRGKSRNPRQGLELQRAGGQHGPTWHGGGGNRGGCRLENKSLGLDRPDGSHCQSGRPQRWCGGHQDFLACPAPSQPRPVFGGHRRGASGGHRCGAVCLGAGAAPGSAAREGAKRHRHLAWPAKTRRCPACFSPICTSTMSWASQTWTPTCPSTPDPARPRGATPKAWSLRPSWTASWRARGRCRSGFFSRTQTSSWPV